MQHNPFHKLHALLSYYVTSISPIVHSVWNAIINCSPYSCSYLGTEILPAELDPTYIVVADFTFSYHQIKELKQYFAALLAFCKTVETTFPLPIKLYAHMHIYLPGARTLF